MKIGAAVLADIATELITTKIFISTGIKARDQSFKLPKLFVTSKRYIKKWKGFKPVGIHFKSIQERDV